jgi:hypothetical protein
MPDDLTTELDEPGDGQQGERIGDENQRNEIKRLKRELAAKTQEAQDAADTKRELLFLKANVDPDKPGATWFIKGYDGEMTVEAIKAAADQAGLSRTVPTAPPAGSVIAPGETVGGIGVDPATLQAAGLAAMAAATANPAAQPGQTQAEQMRALAAQGFKEAGTQGAIDAITQYMIDKGAAAEGATVTPRGF